MEKAVVFRWRGAARIHNWFFRLLFSYLPLFLIVLALVFTSFLLSFSERNQKELQTVSEYIDNSIKQSLDNHLKAIFLQTSSEMNADNPIMVFFKHDAASDPLIDYKVMTKLQEIKNAFPLIDSLYAVRFSDNTVVGNESIALEDAYPDKAFIEKHRGEPYTIGWSSVRSVKSWNGSVQQVVSLIRRGFPSPSDSGMLVINIKLASLGSFIEQLTGSNYPYVRITDKDGQPIVGTTGSGKNEAVAETVSSYTGWTYSIRWLDRKAPIIYNTVPKLWMMVMVLASLFGIAGIVYATYRNYRPVRAITSLIDEFTRKEAVRITRGFPNEMKYIEHVIHTLIDRSLESRELAEHRFFRDLLDGTKRFGDSWKSAHNRLNKILPDSRFTVIVIGIDHFSQFVEKYSQRDQELLKYVLKSMVQEMLQEHRLANWAEWTNSRQLACIVAQPSDVDARILYAKIVEWVHANLRYTVTIGVGHDVMHADDLGASHAEAIRALQYKAAHGINRVIEAVEISGETVPISRYFTLTRSVAEALRVSRQDTRLKLRGLFEAMRRDRIDQESLKQIVKDLVIQLEQEIGAACDRNANSPTLEEYRLEEAETVDEAEEMADEVAEAVFSHMDSVRETRHHRAQLEQIRSFVVRHFSDLSLSLDLLGRRFEINPKYISRLFKDEFGINFVDFVINLRIEHACGLLVNTDRSVQEIAEMSGYTSPISFRRTFKKVTGLTPGEYRMRKKE
ncbi:helix-turn-helix domain-containing protein [Paenibacillus humicola]|uniref:helix-turn-helix domain-containing protein n=1 Tax=Paenibacillus humicola TaxID=3110540 RepID=UPI00237AA454|nr:helix-turn-helix domain-containing protein [Paenibacillus humicola]